MTTPDWEQRSADLWAAIGDYREALATGLTGIRRRRAVIQLASTLRNLGPGDKSISVLACNFTGAPADPGPVSFRYLVIEFS